MSAHSHLLPDYRRVRQLSLRLGHKLVETLSKDVIDEAGQKLGMLEGRTIVLESEDEMAVLMDYAIYNVHRRGRNAVQKMLEGAPPSDPDERALLEAQSNAYYSLFVVISVESGVGVALQDVLRGDEIFVMDVSLGKTARNGLGLASRVIPQPGYFVTGGAMLPFDARATGGLERDLGRWLARRGDLTTLDAAEEAELTAQIIRACRQFGSMEHVRYAAPGESARSGRWSAENAGRVRANRNDPCPCGSGRKYKSCCGKR